MSHDIHYYHVPRLLGAAMIMIGILLLWRADAVEQHLFAAFTRFWERFHMGRLDEKISSPYETMRMKLKAGVWIVGAALILSGVRIVCGLPIEG